MNPPEKLVDLGNREARMLCLTQYVRYRVAKATSRASTLTGSGMQPFSRF